jgi:hypothetical protein
MLPLSRFFRPQAGLATNASDAPCRAPRVPGNPSLFRGTRIASTALSSMRAVFPTQNVFHRQVLSERTHFRGAVRFVRARHRCPGFATEARLPTLFRFSRCSRTEELDPSTDPRALHPRARGAARRLSTSAIESIREHDPVKLRIARTPRTVQVVAHLRSSCRGWLRLAQQNRLPFGRSFAGARPVESSRVRDRGPGAFAPHYLGTSHCDRSPRELCPNPIDSDTSCRKLVTSQAGVSCAVGPRFREPLFTCLPDERR